MPYSGRFLPLFMMITFLLQISYATEFFMLPEEEEKAIQHLYHSIESAQKRIVVTAFGLSHRGIVKVLKSKAKAGVVVSVLFDRKNNTDNPYSQIGYLAKYKNIEVYTVSKGGKDNKGLMHMNSMIIDGEKACLTSLNWSFSGFRRNHEFFLMTEDIAVVEKLLRKMEILMDEGERY